MALSENLNDSLGRDVAATRGPVSQARHVPGHIYTSLEIYQREKDSIFMQDWLCVGRSEDLTNTGDYLTLRAMGEPLIVARDQAGKLNAFANVCAHRGVEVATGEGNTQEFSCPYHGWLYDLTGKLVGAPYMKEAEDFDPAKCRLKPLALAEWAGWVFVSFNVAPRPFADVIAPFEEAFAPIRQADLRVAYRFDVELECNWKFIYENLLDTYHVSVLHSSTIGAFYETTENENHYGLSGAFTAEYKTKTQAPDGIPLFGMIPWLAERGDNFAMNGYLPPNMSLFIRCDNVNNYTTWPLGPDKCLIRCYHLIAPDFFDDPDYESKIQIYRDYQQSVLEEDRSMLASMQRAMTSRAYVPGRMSKLESGIHHVINNHLDRVVGRTT